MMTKQDIDNSLNLDVQTYNNKIYQGYIPEGLVEKFKVGIMMMPPSNHQFSVQVIRSIIGKRDCDLTVMEVGVIINLIFIMPPERLFETIEQWIEYQEQLVKCNIEYNKATAEYNKHLERRRNKLYEIAGLKQAIQMPQIKN